MNHDAMLLVKALREPAGTASLDADGWTALIAIARAEQLIGTLAMRLEGQTVPGAVAAILADAKINSDQQKQSALWEAECAARTLAEYPGKVVLMKGTAYVAARLKAGEGRHIGDLDIMVARDDLGVVEALLLEKGGWEWVKEDAYDDAYYRDHMHELPPMIHTERDRMIDVHHTILPLTARPKPDAAAMLAASSPLPQAGGAGGGPDSAQSSLRSSPPPTPPASGRGDLAVLSPTDMACHCAAHLIADGDLAGGLRNLWDFHQLLDEFVSQDPGYFAKLRARAEHQQLWPAVNRAARLAHRLYGIDLPKDWLRWNTRDYWFIRCMTARDGWGRSTRKGARLIFYIRSHWMRMPPIMLAGHLWTKWRKSSSG
jgi:hypothetical protein